MQLLLCEGGKKKNFWFRFPFPLERFFTLLNKEIALKEAPSLKANIFVNRILNKCNKYIFNRHYYFSHHPPLNSTDFWVLLFPCFDCWLCMPFLFYFLSFSAQTPLIVIKLKLGRAQTASWHFTRLYGYRRLWTLLTTSWGSRLWNPGKTWIPRNKVTPPQCYWIRWRRERLSLPRTWSSRRSSRCLRRTSVSFFSVCISVLLFFFALVLFVKKKHWRQKKKKIPFELY